MGDLDEELDEELDEDFAKDVKPERGRSAFAPATLLPRSER